ncbi:hypothetical protein [Bradyrhizobium sp. USDA 336]|uniref:hypothetical protein n=1 Tax=Bradyrhizobium sp. USDA 336 TaxID=3156311 RepID=UPI003838ED0F
MLDALPIREPTSAIVAVILPVANRDTLNIRGGLFQSGGHLDEELLALICRTGESSRGRFELRGGGKDRFNHRPNGLLEFGYKAKTVGPALIGSRSILFGYCRRSARASSLARSLNFSIASAMSPSCASRRCRS